MKSFIINRMYAGEYLTRGIGGGEVINLLHSDDKVNYCFINPSGMVNSKYDDTVSAVIHTRLSEAAGFEIKDIESAVCNTSLLQSYMWEFDKKFYSHLDIEYEIIDSNISERITDTSLIVYVKTYDDVSRTFYFVDDYIYLRNDNKNTTYVSIKKTNIDYSKIYSNN